jgi:hypothetical protein
MGYQAVEAEITFRREPNLLHQLPRLMPNIEREQRHVEDEDRAIPPA